MPKWIIKCWHFKRQLFSGTRLIEIWRAKRWISVGSTKLQLKILTRMSTGWRGLGKFFVSDSAWSQANAVLDMLIFDFHGKCSFFSAHFVQLLFTQILFFVGCGNSLANLTKASFTMHYLLFFKIKKKIKKNIFFYHSP